MRKKNCLGLIKILFKIYGNVDDKKPNVLGQSVRNCWGMFLLNLQIPMGSRDVIKLFLILFQPKFKTSGYVDLFCLPDYCV